MEQEKVYVIYKNNFKPHDWNWNAFKTIAEAKAFTESAPLNMGHDWVAIRGKFVAMECDDAYHEWP